MMCSFLESDIQMSKLENQGAVIVSLLNEY